MLLHDIESVRARWAALARETDARPFDRPEWTEAWAACFSRGRLVVATHDRGDRLAAALPLVLTPGRARAATSWHAPELPLAAADPVAREALLTDVFALPTPRVEVEFLSADAVEDPVAVVAARGAWRQPVVRAAGRAPYVELDHGTFAEYEARLSRNRRRSLRRAWRGIRAAGPVTVDVWSGGGDLGARLEEVFAVEAAGWKGRRGTAMATWPAARGFYTRVARWGAQQGWLRLSFLRVRGRAVAVDFGLVHGGTWYSLKGGYDERWRQFGPGALLLHALLEHAHGAGVRRFDLLSDGDAFKDAWATASRTLVRVHAFRPTPSGMAGLAETALRARLWPVVDRLRTVAADRRATAGAT